MTDQYFFTAFAKISAVFCYGIFLSCLVLTLILFAKAPPEWAIQSSYAWHDLIVILGLFGFAFIHFMFIPVALAFAKHDLKLINAKSLQKPKIQPPYDLNFIKR